MFLRTSRLLRLSAVVFLALGLLAATPVLAQESSPPADDAPSPVPIAVNADRTLTNGEAAVLLADLMGLKDEAWLGLFSDVAEGGEGASAIEALALAGVVTGNLDGTFQPDEVISRGAFAVWVDRAFFADSFPAEPAGFEDVSVGADYADAVDRLYALGVSKGCSAEPMLLFCGDRVLTVEEAETLVRRAQDLPYVVSDCEDPGQWLLLCDVYELIDTEYVFDVTLEELATPVDAAFAAVVEEAGESAETRTRFDCSIPDVVFESICQGALVLPEVAIADVAEVAVRQMVTALDRNSRYHDPEEWQEIEEEGNYVGIGVRVITVNDEWQPFCTPLSDTCRIFIFDVFEGGPASAAGLSVGDFIVAVDGSRLHDLTLAEAAGLIRGEIDTTVDITIERDGEEHTLTLIRKEIVVPYTSAAFHETESIAYIKLSSFSQFPGGAIEEFRERLEAAKDRELLVLDLRNNPGGRVLELQGIAGSLLGDVPVMTFHTVEESYDLNGTGELLINADTPRIAVLVNGSSASASEVLAGLLYETGRAVIIGETTFKKNTGQSLFDLFNEGVFRLTTIRWTTPGGIDIGENGVPLHIETEVPVGDPQELMDWVKEILENPPEGPSEEDPETPDGSSQTPEEGE